MLVEVVSPENFHFRNDIVSATMLLDAVPTAMTKQKNGWYICQWFDTFFFVQMNIPRSYNFYLVPPSSTCCNRLGNTLRLRIGLFQKHQLAYLPNRF